MRTPLKKKIKKELTDMQEAAMKAKKHKSKKKSSKV
jgi:hypothetical protein